MDPLTHTLVGANLGASRLGDKTRLAAAALVIGANLPDVDAILYFIGERDLAFWFRRGWTHGVLALAVLPLIQTALLLVYARLRPDPSRPVSPRWLLLLSFFAILTHPALDWLNTYGMRWLMPFRGTWFYGDSVYIMDPWLWLILGAGWLAGRKPTASLIAVYLAAVLLLSWVVGRRDRGYLAVVAIVAAILFLVLLWRTKKPLATIALVLAAAYIGARITISHLTARAVLAEVPRVTRLMVAPHPIDPTRWDVVARVGDEHYRYGRYSWRAGGLTLAPQRIPVAKPSPEWTAVQSHRDVRGYVNWARFPWYEVERTPRGTRVTIYDARSAPRGATRSGVVVVIP